MARYAVRRDRCGGAGSGQGRFRFRHGKANISGALSFSNGWEIDLSKGFSL